MVGRGILSKKNAFTHCIWQNKAANDVNLHIKIINPKKQPYNVHHATAHLAK
jgi:hypothetical protein